jgi:hypothetical protein
LAPLKKLTFDKECIFWWILNFENLFFVAKGLK